MMYQNNPIQMQSYTTQQAIVSGFNSANSNIADLGYKMDQCCCQDGFNCCWLTPNLS